MSDSLENYRKRLAPTRDEAIEYVQSELEKVVPKGWVVERFKPDQLIWWIRKTEFAPGEWRLKAYNVKITEGLDLIVFTYGNNDRGPGSLDQSLLKSLLIDPHALRHYGLSACVEHLMKTHEPNEWGYT